MRTFGIWLTAFLLGALPHVGGTAPDGGDSAPPPAVLVIGIGEYRHWTPLPGADDERRLVRELFEHQGAVVRIGFGASRETLEKELRDFAGQYGTDPGTRVILYFAGHGHTTGDGRGVLVPADAPRPDDPAFRERVVDLELLGELAGRMKAEKALFILDSCFSGAAFDAIFRQNGGKAVASPDDGKYVRAVITAGGAREKVPDDGRFRKRLENGLAGGADFNNDGFVTSQELGVFMIQQTRRETPRANIPLHDRRGWGNVPAVEDFFLPVVTAGRISARKSPLEFGQRPLDPVRRVGDWFVDECLPSSRLFTLGGRCPLPRMRVLPPGEFRFGSPREEEGRDPDEHVADASEPPSTVRGMAVSETEITFEEWDACVQDGGCDRWPDDEGWGRGRRPVIHVTWWDAQRYVAWLTRQTGASYRLPNEVEWEYAARAGVSSSRPWGDRLGVDNANCRDCGSPDAGRRTSITGEFPPNGFELRDMLGNVWEWAGDSCYMDNASRRGDDPCDHALRVVRGGSFATSAEGVRSAARGKATPERKADNIGFRVAREIRMEEPQREERRR